MPPDAPRPGPYRHYKGGLYTVLCVGRHSETEEWLVTYRAEASGTFWVRPLAMWSETVRHEGVAVPRFAAVAEADGRASSATGPHGHDQIARARSCLPTGAVDAVLAEGWLTPGELDEVVLPRKTLSHRRKLGLLTPDQSHRLSRVTRIIALARETFGNDDKAKAWLRRPTAPLGGESPLRILDTDQGVREVETLLGRIAHGIAV